jgi:hypothetical protein
MVDEQRHEQRRNSGDSDDVPTVPYQDLDGELPAEVGEFVEEVRSSAVYSVEEDPPGIWFSGMNGDLLELTERVGQELYSRGYPSGPVLDDGVHAVENGGVFMPVNDGEAFPSVMGPDALWTPLDDPEEA